MCDQRVSTRLRAVRSVQLVVNRMQLGLVKLHLTHYKAAIKVPRLSCEVFDSRMQQLDFTGALYFQAQVLSPSS